MSKHSDPPTPLRPDLSARTGPVALSEDESTGDRFLVYQAKDGVRVDLQVQGDTFWATHAQMAVMFGVDRRTVAEHLSNVYAEGELAEASTCRKFRQVRLEGTRQVSREVLSYDLNALISVGYRVGGPMGTLFRIWATDKLFQYLTKGFVIDDRRLKNPGGLPDHFGELLERIRDIRSSERRMWTRVLELASFCNDYDPGNARQHGAFFAAIQNAMHWAVTQQTAAEVIFDRVDAAKEGAGLTNFDSELPTVAEAKVAKNYYAEGEIVALNAITSLTLEFFESQAEQRRPTTLDQFLDKMRELIRIDGRPVIAAGHRGQRSKDDADNRAAEQIAQFKERARLERELAGDRALREIASNTRDRKRKRRTEKTD